ncbi:MAG: AAA family ATPase [Deltaproteobacteria bacterium]|nr:AAA family ATPase [Deltaproteobacteria bacterium]
MYERFFYLTEKPFHITPDPHFLYMSGSHAEAIDLLLYGIKEKKGFILLTGEVGTGKTTLCRALLGKLDKKTESALILNPIVSDHELLKTIISDFGITVDKDTVKEHLDKLNEFLLRIASNKGRALVIIDEAQNLSETTLEMVRLLSNLETEKDKLLQIVLVGQPELLGKLALPELRQLNQRIIVRCSLSPLPLADTPAYIQTRLFAAGGKGTVQFTQEAIAAIHYRSLGVPRMINIICDRAMTAAFVAEKRMVDERHVTDALAELEKEGYVPFIPDRLIPAYERYMPHIALSILVVGFVAGVIWGPPVFQKLKL